MAILRFDEAKLLTALDRLTPDRRAIFAAACAQRLARFYDRHCEDDSHRMEFRFALESLWADLEGRQQTDSTVFEGMARKVEDSIPGDDSPDLSPLSGYLEDAAASTAYALTCRATGDSQAAAWAARRCYEAADHFSHTNQPIDFDEPNAEDRILMHPVVQQELNRQFSDLQRLASPKDASAIAALLHQEATANPIDLETHGPGATRET